MKKVASFCFIFQLCINLSAQKWLAPSAQWNYTAAWFVAQGNINVKMGADTTIEGHQCQTQLRSRLVGLTTLDSAMYSYRANDTVYYFVNGKFRPMLYLGLSKGDSVLIYGDGVLSSQICYQPDSLFSYKIDSVYYLRKGVDSLKTYLLKSTSKQIGMLHPYSLTYSEKIGYHDFVYPKITCSTDPEIFYLCDYGDSTMTDFWFYGKGISCQSVDVDFVSTAIENMEVSPNPAQSKFKIHFPNDKQQLNTFEMYSINGKKIMEVERTDVSFEINCSDLPNGIYFLKSPNFTIQKLVVAH